MEITQMNGTSGELKSPVRNRYFYGKMLDVFHFELEQDYFNQKRWLLNRRMAGWGVLCGLDVNLGPDGRSIIVQPGLALDRCGREIIVACPSAPVPLDRWMKLPVAPSATAPTTTPTAAPAATVPTDGIWVHVCLCYQECETDPVPALGGDCDTEAICSSGAIRERYKIDVYMGKLPMPQPKCNLADLFSNRTLDYGALARYITRACPSISDNCCIPIANIQLPAVVPQSAGNPLPAGTVQQNTAPVIDISIRPVVLTNPMLFQLMLCLCGGTEQTPCSGSTY